jgi:hypothetical protein
MTSGTYAGGEPTLGNRDNLPAVKTCYSMYELNEAVKNGHQTCIMKITESEKLRLTGIFFAEQDLRRVHTC